MRVNSLNYCRSHHGNRGILSKDGLKEDKVETAQSGCQGNKCVISQQGKIGTSCLVLPFDG